MDAGARPAYELALARLVEGEAEPGDGELIARAMQDDPACLRAVSGMLAIDDLLRQHAEPNRSAFAEAFAAGIQAESSGGPFVARISGAVHGRATARPRRPWLPWGLAAAAVLAAVIGWSRSAIAGGGAGRPAAAVAPAPVAVAPAHGAVVAIMVNEAGARFADGAGPDAVSFGAGDFSLVHGAAHVRFSNGADVVFVAPSSFTIIDALHLRLADGSLRALVPPAAHGFVVDTAQVRFRDLGTEFGVTARPDRTSDLHVFAGQVEVYPAGASSPAATLAVGESARYVHGVGQPLEAAREGDYPTPQSISLARWKDQRERLQDDPDLVLYYPFVAQPEDAGTLRDAARHGGHVDGRISGAQWVAGRWPGKQALQFERPGDRVALEIPGEYDRITLAAWIKIDRLDQAANGLLMSVGWRPGDLQWQFDRLGSPVPSSLYSSPKRRVLATGSPVPTGRWAHCAVVMDRIAGRLLHYVDGQPAGEAQVAALTTTIKPGACLIGSWIADNKTQEDRDFRGRIDELAMWKVALSPAQIARLAHEGMPIELPVAGPPAAEAGRGAP